MSSLRMPKATPAISHSKLNANWPTFGSVLHSACPVGQQLFAVERSSAPGPVGQYSKVGLWSLGNGDDSGVPHHAFQPCSLASSLEMISLLICWLCNKEGVDPALGHPDPVAWNSCLHHGALIFKCTLIVYVLRTTGQGQQNSLL